MFSAILPWKPQNIKNIKNMDSIIISQSTSKYSVSQTRMIQNQTLIFPPLQEAAVQITAPETHCSIIVDKIWIVFNVYYLYESNMQF